MTKLSGMTLLIFFQDKVLRSVSLILSGAAETLKSPASILFMNGNHWALSPKVPAIKSFGISTPGCNP